MGLFRKRAPEPPRFPPEDFEPVLRCSICTGEQTACLRDRKTGELHEVMPIRSEEELEAFCQRYGEVRKIY